MNLCRTCKWRSTSGYCQNDDKIRENCLDEEMEDDDRLLYDYCESGGFWVGPNFGCVHHEAAQ